MIVKSYINRGNSFPIIVQTDAKEYFVKLRAGMSGKYGIVAEWFGNKLGSAINIKTQIPNWIEITKDIELEEIHFEVKELIHKSLGINISFDFQEDSKELCLEALKELPKEKANEIYLFDLMMINIDRTPSNLNLMKANDEVYSVDYESSLLISALIENRNLLDDSRILECLRTNPLYDEIDEATSNQFISRLDGISIEKILDEIPTSLLTKDERYSVLKGFDVKRKDRWSIQETLNKLKEITVETDAQKRTRINKNQADFKRKFKENTTIYNK